jgi:hypothetical protein
MVLAGSDKDNTAAERMYNVFLYFTNFFLVKGTYPPGRKWYFVINNRTRFVEFIKSKFLRRRLHFYANCQSTFNPTVLASYLLMCGDIHPHSGPTTTSKATKHKCVKSRIQYHNNTSAAHNVTTSATLLSGDVHPNPGPATTTQDRTKLSSLRTLYLNARSLKALVDSPDDDNSQKISKLNIFQNLVYLNQYDIV